MNWRTAKLSDIAVIERHQIDPTTLDGATSYLGLEDIEAGGRIIQAQQVQKGDLLSTKFRFTDQHILYGKLRPYLAKISLPEFGGICSTDILPLRPKKETDRRFLAYFLRQPEMVELANSRTTGANLPRLSPKALADFDVPVPPIDEQRRIAAILGKADAIRRKNENALALSDDFLKSMFLEMFGDPIVNAKGLPKQPLGRFGKIVTGNTPPRSEPENFGGAIEWIKSDNVNTEEHFLTRAVEGLSARGKALGRVVPKGSILVTCIAGSPSSIGRAAIADRAVALNQQINAITPNRDVNLYFLYAQFLVGKSLVLRSSTNSMKGMISKGEFQKIEFLCPEPDEQERFGRIFETQIKASKLLRETSNRAADLFSTLSHRAFSGEI